MTVELSSADILSNARALAPQIRERAPEIAAARKLPADLVETLRQAGVFRISMPKSWGGPEMPLPQQVELMEILGEADASVSWCVKIGSESGVTAALLSEAAARKLYPSLDLVNAGQVSPNGRAIKVPGGYRISGRWSFASGSTHADVMVAGCLAIGPDAPAPGTGPAPRHILAMAPAAAFQIEDTWQPHGLAGSGSNHYATQDLFVPEDCVIELSSRSNWCSGSLYTVGFQGVVITAMAGTPLGLARHAIDTACALALEKKVSMMPAPPVPMKDVARVQSAIGQAEMLYGAARAFVYDSVNRIWTDVESRKALEPKNMILACINAFRMAESVTHLLYDTIGPAAVYQSAKLEGLMRDAATMNRHFILSESVVQREGLIMLGGGRPPRS